jgi:hypothetical protein
LVLQACVCTFCVVRLMGAEDLSQGVSPLQQNGADSVGSMV